MPAAEPAGGRTDLPPRELPAQQLVVARYKEDLTWLTRVEMPVIVYCKDPDCRVSEHVHLPNTKREAGTMLHHIVTHYHRLARCTYFAQGDPFDHARDFLKRLKLTYDQPTALTMQYLRHHPPPEVKAHDKVEIVQGFMVRYGDATHKGHAPRAAQGWYNPATWRYVFACPQPRPLWFGYGAMWAVPREAILARPLALWRHLLEVCDPGRANNGEVWTDPPINPWMMEATWYYLFQDPALYPHHRKWDRLPLPSPRGMAAPLRTIEPCPPRGSEDANGRDEAVCGVGRGGPGNRVAVQNCLARREEPEGTA